MKGLGGVPEAIGGVADHVHLLVGLKSTHCLADFMRDLKKAATNWVHESIEQGEKFARHVTEGGAGIHRETGGASSDEVVLRGMDRDAGPGGD